MLHLYYQDFLGVRLSGGNSPPGCPQARPGAICTRKAATTASASQELLEAQERLAAQRDSSAVDQLRDAFAQSELCQHCRLSGEVRDFADWRAKSLKELALHGSVINCWVNILAAPFDWKSVRYDPCLCPFAFGYWGLRWQPVNVEATCLLLAQSFSAGADVHLRLSNSSTVIPCHSFLLQEFIHLYKRGAWPQGCQCKLMKEGRVVVLELNYRYYSLEILQFVFYSAYGHVLTFSPEELTVQTFALLKSVVKHLTGEPKSICRHLVDVPGLLTNLIVLLDRLVRRVRLSDSALCRLVPDLVGLLRVNRLFDELHQRLLSRLYSEAKACLEDDAGGTDGSSARLLLQLHRGGHCCHTGDCIYLDLAVNLFRRLVLRQQQQQHPLPADGLPPVAATLEASLQAYLAALVDLYEVNRSEAMVTACRDLRCVCGILCLIDQPCSDSVASFRSLLIHVSHTLLLLICDQVVLNFIEVLWIHNSKFAKRVAFQSQLSLVRQHRMPQNTFWNPVSTASKDRGLELVLVHFKFTVSLAQTIIRLATRLESAGSTDCGGEPAADLLRGFHAELSCPEMLGVLNYPTLARKVEQLQESVAKVSARDMRSIAYASYSTVRMPRMRLVVQTVALLQVAASRPQDADKLLASEVGQASEGRQILCTEEAMRRLVRELQPVQFFAGLEHCADLWHRLEAYARSSNCSFGSSGGGAQQQAACPDHGTYHQACLLWAWFRALVAAVAVLRRSSRVFASPDAFRGAAERFIAGRADFFRAHAADLADSGEMERAHHDLLLDLLARLRRRRPVQQAGGLSRLPPAPGSAAASPAPPLGLSFELQLLPSLCFHFVPHHGCQTA